MVKLFLRFFLGIIFVLLIKVVLILFIMLSYKFGNIIILNWCGLVISY